MTAVFKLVEMARLVKLFYANNEPAVKVLQNYNSAKKCRMADIQSVKTE